MGDAVLGSCDEFSSLEGGYECCRGSFGKMKGHRGALQSQRAIESYKTQPAWLSG